MDYNKRHFERFSCRICALTITELLHLTFTRKTSSFSARLSSHAAKPNTTFHSNHTHTTCSHKNVTKPQGLSLYKQNCHVPHACGVVLKYCGNTTSLASQYIFLAKNLSQIHICPNVCTILFIVYYSALRCNGALATVTRR